MINTRKLKGVIIERGFTQDQIAEILGISDVSFNYKLNCKRDFKLSEVQRLINVLKLKTEQISAIFFSSES